MQSNNYSWMLNDAANDLFIDCTSQTFDLPTNISAAPSNSSKINQHVDNLRSVDEIPVKYRSIFECYSFFNIIQSRVFDVVINSDKPVVVSAPTGSGKTVIFELAIVQLLIDLESYSMQMPFKIVYIAPMKALCEERLVDWNNKFASLGLNCISVTGDNDNFDFQNLLSHNLFITTPEKWDSLTRKWRDNKKLVSLVKLFMIDEVHLLGDDNRGPTLEVIVNRMKTIQESLIIDEDDPLFSKKIRFVAVSATIPNAEDIAAWLSMPTMQAKTFLFKDDMRPVKLKKVVLGYDYNMQMSTPFKFDIMLNYKLQTVMLQYAEGKPTLIFCSTRKNVEMTSKHITQNITINLNPYQRGILQSATCTITDPKIKAMLVSGVSYHHAGLSLEDRRIIENLFRNANLPILVTTSTLAMGVNLPAHLVIIKSTKYYCNGEYQDYNECMLLQMIGRAGRPQFDTSATAVILTTAADKQKFENMLGGEQPVESNLHKHLAEHLNAEIVLHTITDLGVAMQWLTSTFLHIRARKHPRHYGLPAGLSPDQIDKKLLGMCQIEINRLARGGMLKVDQNDVRITPTETGSLMAKYCVAFDTMKLFTQVTGKEIMQQILALISKCQEFSEIYLRVNDKKSLNLLNKCRDRETIRFPLNGKIKTVDMKINCIIQAVFGSLQILEPSLITESQKIMRIGERLSNCLSEYLVKKDNCYSALLSALVLAKCFHTRLWENSPFVSKQLSGIGNAFSSALVAADKTTFKALLDMNPRDIERIINRKPPTGNTIQEQIEHLPNYELVLEETIGEETLFVDVKIYLRNASLLRAQSGVDVNRTMNLLIGATDNNIILYEKYKHAYFIQNPEVHKTFHFSISYTEEINAHLISEDWVGLDCEASLLPTAAKKNLEIQSKENAVKSKKKTETNRKHSHIQTLVDTFFKKTKNSNKSRKQQVDYIKQTDNNKENAVNTLPNEKPFHRQNSLESDCYQDTSEDLQVQTFSQPEKSFHRQNSLKSDSYQDTSEDLQVQGFSKPEDDLINKTDETQTQVAWKKIINEAVQEYKDLNKKELQKTQYFENRLYATENYLKPIEYQGLNITDTDSDLLQTQVEPVLKKIIYDSAQESKTPHTPHKRDWLEKGYYIPPQFMLENLENSPSVVQSNNYSATVKRTSEANTSSTEINVPPPQRSSSYKNVNGDTRFKSMFKFSQLTPKNKNRLKENMNCTVEFERSVRDGSPGSIPEKDVLLTFKYTPRKKHSHKSEMTKEIAPIQSNSSQNEKYQITERVKPKIGINKYSQEHFTHILNRRDDASETLRSNENLQKSITWRSPLVISPTTKYSPVFQSDRRYSENCPDKSINLSFSSWNKNNPQIDETKTNLTFGININDSADVSTFSTPSETSTTVKYTRPTLKENSTKFPRIPLSDSSYLKFASQKECSKDLSESQKLVEDEFISSCVLESLGCAQKKNACSQINQSQSSTKKVKSATITDYYQRLINHQEKEALTQKNKGNASFQSNENQMTINNNNNKNKDAISNLNDQNNSDNSFANNNTQNMQNFDISLNESSVSNDHISHSLNTANKSNINLAESFQNQTKQLFNLSAASDNYQNRTSAMRNSQHLFDRHPSQTEINMRFNSQNQEISQEALFNINHKESYFNIATPQQAVSQLTQTPQASSTNLQRHFGRHRSGSYSITPTCIKREYEHLYKDDCQCFNCIQSFRNEVPDSAQFSCCTQPNQAVQRCGCNECTKPYCHLNASDRCTTRAYIKPNTFCKQLRPYYQHRDSCETDNSFMFEHPFENVKRQKLEMHSMNHCIPTSKRNTVPDHTNMHMPNINNRSLRRHNCSFHEDLYSCKGYTPPPDSPCGVHYVTDFDRRFSRHNHGDKEFLLQRYLHSVEQNQMEHENIHPERQVRFMQTALGCGFPPKDTEAMPEHEFVDH